MTVPTCPEADAGELALAQETIRELEAELYGVPVLWTDDIPGDYQPDAVQQRIRDAMEACDVPADLVGFDCDEVPCFAILHGEDEGAVGALIHGCPTWSEVWSASRELTSSARICPDGSHRALTLVSPGSGLPRDPDRENTRRRDKVRLAAAGDRVCD